MYNMENAVMCDVCMGAFDHTHTSYFKSSKFGWCVNGKNHPNLDDLGKLLKSSKFGWFEILQCQLLYFVRL